MRTFEEILSDVARSCNRVLYSGYKNNYSDVIKTAAEIYVAELQTESFKERDCTRELGEPANTIDKLRKDGDTWHIEEYDLDETDYQILNKALARFKKEHVAQIAKLKEEIQSLRGENL